MEAVRVEQRTVFGEKVVRSANDELGNHLPKLLQLLFARGLHYVSRVRVSPSNNSVLKVLSKIVFRA